MALPSLLAGFLIIRGLVAVHHLFRGVDDLERLGPCSYLIAKGGDQVVVSEGIGKGLHLRREALRIHVSDQDHKFIAADAVGVFFGKGLLSY